MTDSESPSSAKNFLSWLVTTDIKSFHVGDIQEEIEKKLKVK